MPLTKHYTRKQQPWTHLGPCLWVCSGVGRRVMADCLAAGETAGLCPGCHSHCVALKGPISLPSQLGKAWCSQETGLGWRILLRILPCSLPSWVKGGLCHATWLFPPIPSFIVVLCECYHVRALVLHVVKLLFSYLSQLCFCSIYMGWIHF